MNPEDRLDHLLRQPRIRPDELTEREADLLDVAADVQDLRAMRVPPEFAARLEARVRERARQMQSGGDTSATPGMPTTTRFTPPSARRIIMTAGGALAVVLVLAVAIFAASANSLPGDWLYGVKQFGNQIALAQAHTPAARAQVAIQQLRDALSDLRAEVNDGRADDDILQAIGVVRSLTQSAQTAVAAIPGGSDLASAQQSLATALADEQSVLRNLLATAHWPVRVALTSQLGATGASVPAISSVDATITGNGQVIIGINGAHFVAGAQVLLDGTILSAPQSLSADHIVIKITAETLPDGPHTIGVQDPDGTAATADFTVNGSHGRSGDRPTPGPQHTPGPQGTPGNGNGNGHHGTPTPSGTPGKGNGNGSGKGNGG